jgi:8-oxo-dGDP phosphatase
VTFEPMIGMVRNAHHVFVARGAERVGEATELNEGRFEWLPLAEVPGLIAKGRIVNSGSLVGLLHVLALSGPRTSRAE